MFLMGTLGVVGGGIGLVMLGNHSQLPGLVVLGVTILACSGLFLVTVGRTWKDNGGSLWRVGVAYVTKMSLGVLFIHNVMAVVSPGGDTYLKRTQNRSSGMLCLLVLTPIVMRLVRVHEGFWTPRNVLSPYHSRRLGV